MTFHSELSALLAQALGWPTVKRFTTCAYVIDKGRRAKGRIFDYRDPTVIVPLIEWLGKRHILLRFWSNHWTCCGHYGDTLADAVARAVIAVKAAERKR